MAATLADNIFKWNFFNENGRIMIQISLKFVPKNPIDNKPALLQLIAWRWTSDKPLPEPMINLFTNAYMNLGGDELKTPFITEIHRQQAIAWTNDDLVHWHQNPYTDTHMH